MSRSGQFGYIAMAPQISKSVPATTPVFYKYRATDIDFGAVEPGGLLPPEIAGIITPTGAYKLGAFGAGGFSFTPRLEDDIAWMLYALMGDTAVSGSALDFTHTFKFATDPTSTPWVTMRKWVPASTNYAENVLDCKVGRLRLTIPQAGPVSARVDFVGRVPTFLEDPTWTENTMDDGDTFAVAGASASYVKLPDFSASALPATGCIIEMTNMLSTPQQEFVIGSQYPDDFIVLSRAMTIRWVYKWEDPDLCRLIMTGAATGQTAWTPAVYTSDFEAAVVTAADYLPTTPDTPYGLTVKAEKVSWEPNGPIRLMGNNILAVEFVGTALDPATGEYAEIELNNKVAAYTWPTA